MRLIAAVVTIGALVICGPVSALEPVEIPHGDATLRGFVYRPEGPGPFPGIVALHGCRGLINRSGRITSQFSDWGDRLAAAGIAALFPDSFGSRGLTSQCRTHERRIRASRERVSDAYA